MIKINYISIALILILNFNSFGLTLSRNIPKVSKKVLLSDYRQDDDLNKKIKAIHELSVFKDLEILSMFRDNLCYVPGNMGPIQTMSGAQDLVRINIAVGLRYYQDSNPEELNKHFYAIRKMIEDDPNASVAAEAILTLAMWVRNWDENTKNQLIISIKKRLIKSSALNYRLAIRIITAMKLIANDSAIVLLSEMLRKGYNNKIKTKIQQALDSMPGN